MNKAYSRINWQNKPSTQTPLDATNLNKVDLALDTIDDRVITLDGSASSLGTRVSAVESGKVDKVSGKELSTNDFTDAYKTKVDGISTEANKTTVTQVVMSGDLTKEIAKIGLDGTDTSIYADDALAVVKDIFGTDHTVEGNPISFDAFTGIETVKACSVDLLPIQDLHGYDSPWVGGAGKNRVYKTLKQCNIGSSGIITAYSDYDLFFAEVESGKTYTISVNGIATGTADAGYFSADPALGSVTYDSSRILNLPATFEATYSGYFGFRMPTNTANVQLQEGSTATAYEPYSNICPISGRTEVNLAVRGVNQWDEQWELGSLNTTNGSEIANTTQIRAKNYVPIQPSKQYYFKADNPVWVLFFDANKAVISENLPPMGQSANNARKSNNQPFTTPPNCAYIRFYFQTSYGTTYNNDISVNYPSTDTEYHAYQGETYTETLGQTVYGGKVDFVSGTAVIDRVVETYNGTEDSWGLNSEGKFWKALPAGYSGNIALVCNCYIGKTNQASVNNGECALSNSLRYMNIGDNRFTTLDEFKSNLSSNNLEVCYPLTTPITLTLTEKQIALLKGNNVISTDGDNINLVYSADIKAWVENQLQS